MSDFNETQFKQKLAKAIESTKLILEQPKLVPCSPDEVQHTFDDKYALCERFTNIAVASTLCVLELFGLKPNGLQSLLDWAKTRSVSVRFKGEESCKYLRKVPTISIALGSIFVACLKDRHC